MRLNIPPKDVPILVRGIVGIIKMYWALSCVEFSNILSTLLVEGISCICRQNFYRVQWGRDPCSDAVHYALNYLKHYGCSIGLGCCVLKNPGVPVLKIRPICRLTMLQQSLGGYSPPRVCNIDWTNTWFWGFGECYKSTPRQMLTISDRQISHGDGQYPMPSHKPKQFVVGDDVPPHFSAIPAPLVNCRPPLVAQDLSPHPRTIDKLVR